MTPLFDPARHVPLGDVAWILARRPEAALATDEE